MGQSPWKVRSTNALTSEAQHKDKSSSAGESDRARQAKIDRLQAEIAAGMYVISAESLAARLLRRIRRW